MTDTPPDNTVPAPAADDTAAVPFSVGTTLREARMQQGLSVEDVSSRIKFAPRQIEALEADDFAHVPENAFLRGFVRSYARLLQLDSAPLLAALPHAPENAAVPEVKPPAAEMPYPGIYTERKSNIIWLAAAFGVSLILGLFVLLSGGKHKDQHTGASEGQQTRVESLELPAAVPVSAVSEEPVVVKPAAPVKEKPVVAEAKKTPQPAPAPGLAPPVKSSAPSPAQAVDKKPAASPVLSATPPKPSSSSPDQSATKKQLLPASAVQPAKPATAASAAARPEGGASGPIRVSFSADSWVEIKDRDGNIVMSQLGRNGMEQSTGGKPPFTVTVGYASGVKLFYKGKQIDLAPYARAEVAHLTLE